MKKWITIAFLVVFTSLSFNTINAIGRDNHWERKK